MAGSQATRTAFDGHIVLKNKNGSRTILQSPANAKDATITKFKKEGIMEGIVMVDYGQAVTLVAKMFFLMTITIFLIAITLLVIGVIIYGLAKAGKFLLAHISEAINEPREKILAYKFFSLPNKVCHSGAGRNPGESEGEIS
jgi:hypothetical protein